MNPPTPADWTHTTPEQLLASHVRRGKATTNLSYSGDVLAFRKFLNATEGCCLRDVQAIQRLVGGSRGQASRMLHDYQAWQIEQGKALSTVRRRLQSLMGLLKLAHEFEILPWALKPLGIAAPPAVRDTRGPGLDAYRRMLETCEQRNDPKGMRDLVLLRLMGTCALRCNEALTLDVKHLNIRAREVELLCKGLFGQRIKHPVDIDTSRAIDRWLTHRGTGDGPLFVTFDRRAKGAGRTGERLTYRGAYEVVRAIGRAVDVKCSPHKLRHFAATECLRQSRGNITLAMALTRHRDPRTLMIYNDEAMTKAREAAELVASGVTHYRRER